MVGIKIFFLSLILLSISLSTIFINSSVAENGTPTCDLSATDISFGGLLPNEISATDSTTTLTKTFGTIASIGIYGSDWMPDFGFSVSQTHFSETDSQLYPSMTPLLSTSQPLTATTLTPLNSDDTATVYFKLQVPDDQPAGGYTQTITFSFECEVIE